MSNISSSSLYDFVLQQMAAESYFDTADRYATPGATRFYLELGTNRQNYEVDASETPNADKYPGLTRMTEAQAKEFTDKFQIIDQWSDNPCPDGSRPTQPGDAGYLALNGQQILANTGLSATLIKVSPTEYTLAIRSTEMRPWDKGGDGERDKWDTDFQSIGLRGFAFAQLDALEYYYEWLKTSGKLPANVDLNVTGYSLGGHLATVFTEIHRGEMKNGRTYAFNAPGRGEFGNGDLRSMLADFRRFMADPDAAGVPHVDASQNVKDAYLAAKAKSDAHAAFDAKSLYADPRYLWAADNVKQKYSTGMVMVGLPSEGRTGTSADDLITHVWGKEIPNNANFTALSGIHGQPLGVFIESQPLVEGWMGPWGKADYGNGHSIVLLADSLALMRTMQELQPGLSIESLNALFPNSTNAKSSTAVVGSPRSGEYEYNALENVLDGLRRIFVGSNVDKTDYTKGGSGFADRDMRQKFHEHLVELENSAAFQAAQGNITLTASTPDAGKAKTDFGQFLSLYYLTPFSLTISDAAVEASLLTAQGQVGTDWAHDKALSTADRAAGKAVFSDQYLADRQRMLGFKEEYNAKNKDYSSVIATEFVDTETGYAPKYRYVFTDTSQASEDSEASVIDTSGPGNEASDKQIYFGREVDDSNISGGFERDHLYGMGGNDTLNGLGENDWLEGGNGDDALNGGLGKDTLLGGAGNDTLDGGAGSNLLLGGAGDDVYRLFAGGDINVIDDVDGKITVDDGNGGVAVLNGGKGVPGSDQWVQTVGGNQYTYAFSSANGGVGNLVIQRDDGAVTAVVRNFQNGNLGISLSDLPVVVPTPAVNSGQAVSEYSDQPTSFDALAGNDVVITRTGADTVSGGDDQDYIVSTAGTKLVEGGSGDDFIDTGNHYEPNASVSELQQPQKWQQGWADWHFEDIGGIDYQWSRSLVDQISGQTLASYSLSWRGTFYYRVTSSDQRGWRVVGGSTFTDNQTLLGGMGNDTIDASDGNDVIRGEDGNDLLFGGALGNDSIYGGIGADSVMANAGNDLALGEDGNDFLDGAAGNDTLFGGKGDDTLLGDGDESTLSTAADCIDGGDGNDLIDAGLGQDLIWGGAGNDTIFASSIYNPAAIDANLVDGGDGDDKIVGAAGADTIYGGAGDDVIAGGNDAIAPNTDHDDIYGGLGNDKVTAGLGNDFIDGGDGNDTLFGDNSFFADSLHGNDTVYGGAGDDIVAGDAGNDFLYGGDGKDSLQGDSGKDVLAGGDGIDQLLGGDGNDLLYGDAGDDGFTGTGATKVANGGMLRGGNGNDSIYGGSGQDALLGEEGNDKLYGEDDDDQLEGGDGDDLLDGGSGLDVLSGGTGDDTYQITDGGYDTIYDTAGNDTLILANASVDGVSILQFGSKLQINVGQEALVVIEGGFNGAINRFKFGQSYVDLNDLQPQNIDYTPSQVSHATFQTLDAPTGEAPATATEADPNDLDLRSFLKLAKNGFKIDGGAGKDTLYGGGGADTISSSGDDDLVYAAGGNDNVNGGDGADIIDGEEGNDSLTGGDGNDTLIGGAGNDLINGGVGVDVYEFSSGFGKDVIDDWGNTYAWNKNDVQFTNLLAQDVLSVTRFGRDIVLGFANGDELTIRNFFFDSSTASFNLRFADGLVWGAEEVKQRAVLVATEGNDYLSGWETNDLIDAKGGNDNIQGGDGNDTVFGGQGDDTIYGGTGDDTLYGGAGMDNLFGDSGDDVLEGGQDGQVDNLYGGSGNDTYLIKPGARTYINYQLPADSETGFNIIRFASGINPSGLSLNRDDQDSTLILGYKSPEGLGTMVFAKNFFRAGEPSISEIRFDDFPTIVWTYQDIVQRYMTPTNGDDKISLYETGDQFDALAGNDTIFAMGGDDLVYAGAGRDSIDASFGNDTLAGGLDSDVLKGYEGSDTYLFNLGDGHDWLYEERSYSGWVNPNVPRVGEIDRIKFGAGITQSDISFSRDDRNLIIRVKSDADVITVNNYFFVGTGDSANIDYRIEEIEFNNGTVWKRSDIESRLPVTQVDTLAGTTADNTFTVDDSRDVVIENANAGTDTINSSVSLTIPDNVENVVLTGAGDLTVTANGMNNRITGNAGNNWFRNISPSDAVVGGAGDDTYEGGSNLGVIENPNQGYDTQILYNSSDIYLPDNVEKLITNAIGNITGNSSDNFFDLSAATGYYSSPYYELNKFPMLDGGAGADYFLIGRDLKNDRLTFVVDNSADKIVFLKNPGTVWVNSSINYSLPEELTNLRLLANVSAISATGNSSNNIIRGNQYNNQLSGLDGNDTLLGYGGKDTLIGGAGDDCYYIGSYGYVTLTGELKDEWHTANSDMESIVEEVFGGYDVVNYSIGNPFDSYDLTVPYNIEEFKFNPNAGSQFTIYGNVTINGNDQSNIVEVSGGNSSSVTVLGLGGDDKLSTISYRALLNGGDGNDTLIGGSAPDTLIGGTGTNEFHVNNAKSVYNPETYNSKYETGDVVDARGNNGSGESIVIFDTTASTGVNFDRVGNDLVDLITGVTILGYFAATGFGDGVVNRIQFKDGVIWSPGDVLAHLPAGTSGNDLITGTTAADLLEGKGGDDTLNGLEGNDTLDGGTGADSLLGGAGDDLYKVDNTNDQVVELAGNGIDEVQANVNFTLPDNVEILRLNSINSGLSGKGNTLANAIYGTDFADTLEGSAGADSLYGGNGDDTYICDVADIIQDAGGFDTLMSAGDITSPFDPSSSSFIEKLVLTGSNATKATGSTGNDVLDGSQNTSANTLIGGKGDDEYIVGANDVIVELAGEGLDILGVSVDTTLQANNNLEGLRAYGAIGLRLTGTAATNVLYGNTGNDTLDGLAGADSMYGGAGSDTYYVDNTADVVSDSSTANEDIDTVVSSVTYTLSGSLANLTLSGSSAINGTGNAWNNVLRGNSGVNVLKGGDGSDTFYVSTGDSVVENLDQGWDRVYSDVTFTLGANIEELYLSGSANINGTGNALNNNMYGNAGNNILDGKGGDDWMVGGAGNDTYIQDSEGDAAIEEVYHEEYDPLSGEMVGSWIDAGGIDTVKSSANVGGADEDGNLWGMGSYIENLELTGTTAQLGYGNEIANSILGNSIGNILRGFDGNDTLNGAGGADTMFGGIGDDTYVVDNAGDIVTESAGEGSDLVQSSLTYSLASSAEIENLTLTGTSAINGTGNAKDNILIGNSANNTLTGGAGNDRLNGGTGNDTMIGGAGNDTYVFDVATDVATENANEGTDTIETGITLSIATLANIENITLTGSNAVNATGNAAANLLTGNSGANTLDGGAGIDTLIGGAGNDTYVVDNAGDVVAENANEGTDLISTGISYSLATLGNVENLTLTGTSAINATGNALANTLTGNSGNNVLDGGAGNDTLVGGAGNDTYVVDSLSDVVTEASSAGTDTIQTNLTYTLASLTNVENLTLTGTGAINATGNTLANVLTGNSGNNRIDGGSGNDTMIGGAGNDTYVFNVATDAVTENANEGIDTIEIGVTLSIASVANVENITLTGTSAINATGNTLDNVLLGNSGNNTLTGGAGNDRLDGGAGNDTMLGGTGNDTYVVNVSTDVVTENANEGTDTVESSITYTIASLANLENITLTGSSAINATGNAAANALIGNSGVNVLTGGAGNDTLDGAAGNDSLVGGTGNDTYILGRGYGADSVTENDSTAGNTDVASFMSGISTDQIWFRKVNTNDLEISIIGTSDKLTIGSWYLGNQYHVEQFKTADGKLLVDTDVQKLVDAMAAFAPPAAGQTTLPSNYQTSLSPVLAANWH